MRYCSITKFLLIAALCVYPTSSRATDTALNGKVFFPNVKSSVDLSLGDGLTPALGYYGPNIYLQNQIIEHLKSSAYWYQGGADRVLLEIEIIDFKFSNILGAYSIALTTRSTISSSGISSVEVFASSVKVGLSDALMGSRRNEVGMLRAAADQVSKIGAQLLRFSADLERKALQDQVEQELRAKEAAEAQRVEQQRLAAEQERIEREGDGSEDDLACKASNLKPSTEPYKKCRKSLSAAREAREERERLLAEKFYREKSERERQEQIDADREREKQEERQRRREEAAAKDPYFYVKEQCRELGFKDKTEKFGTCVLELSKRGGDQQTRSELRTARGDGTPDDATCVGYGYSVGSTGYADCRMKLDQARRDYERELRAYQAEKAAYDQRVAEGQAEARRRQQERQAQYGFCVAACSSQPGSTALGCMSRCGAASAGLPFDPGAPPARPSGRTTYVINGRIINCNTSPSGSVVTCN